MLHVDAVKAFNDNYLWVFHEEGQNAACVVDPGDAEPVLRHLAAKGLQLAAILVTHHHADHIGGIEQLLREASALDAEVPVYG
ncbi:MAG TPA: MBL fold metallo-hydrolase, partial [Pseudomonadaceae bacterium]|nr:MBL fold metallo-hydrolase [Pseudomonadaceae bacterium]